jgi:hypothetical protein
MPLYRALNFGFKRCLYRAFFDEFEAGLLLVWVLFIKQPIREKGRGFEGSSNNT